MMLGIERGGASACVLDVARVRRLSSCSSGQLLPRAIARRWPSHRRAVRAAGAAARRARDDADHRRRAARSRGCSCANEAEPRPTPSATRFRICLREGELEGVGEHEEIAIISGVVEFSEKVVRDVMTPRVGDLRARRRRRRRTRSPAQIAQSRYSRVPIYHGTLDNIVGMVHAFDVIKAHGERCRTAPARRVRRARRAVQRATLPHASRAPASRDRSRRERARRSAS